MAERLTPLISGFALIRKPQRGNLGKTLSSAEAPNKREWEKDYSCITLSYEHFVVISMKVQTMESLLLC